MIEPRQPLFKTNLGDKEKPGWISSGSGFTRLNEGMRNFGLCRFIDNSDTQVDYGKLFQEKKQFFLYELQVEKDNLEKERYNLFGSKNR